MVLAVSLDKNEKKLRPLLRESKVDFPVGCDGKEWDSPPAKHLGVRKLPSSFLIDPTGRILHSGVRGPQLESLVEESIKECERAGTLKPPAERGP